MIQNVKFGLKLLIATFGTVGITLTLATLTEAQSTTKTFRYNNQTYTVRVIQGAGDERVIEIGVNAPTESGDRSLTTYRQYSGSCSGSQYSFLGEHGEDRNGVVRFSNPQSSRTIIKVSDGAGKVVQQGFKTACGR
ncbi:hypothetical protein ACE1B6_22805 [Aerosakkonemataceae cyanobacterium BLCC-F154]|uniref:Uncharacterized protein n=1 Tax=Floridaenema fluviatile BLCC-F154 TaxID=3153640 RepID=A0ABV4YHD9_9CYAN